MFKFKTDIEPITTSDLWYDLTDGGYIDPEDILTDQEQIAWVKAAIAILMDFADEAVEQGVIELS